MSSIRFHLAMIIFSVLMTISKNNFSYYNIIKSHMSRQQLEVLVTQGQSIENGFATLTLEL